MNNKKTVSISTEDLKTSLSLLRNAVNAATFILSDDADLSGHDIKMFCSAMGCVVGDVADASALLRDNISVRVLQDWGLD